MAFYCHLFAPFTWVRVASSTRAQSRAQSRGTRTLVRRDTSDTYPDRLQLTLIDQLAYPDNPGHPWASCAGREQGCHNYGVILFYRNLFSRRESNSCVPRLPRCSVDIRGRSWIKHPLIQNIVRLSSIEDSTYPTCKQTLRVIFSECDRCRHTYGQ